MNPNLSPRQFGEYVPHGGFEQKQVDVRGTVGGFKSNHAYEHEYTHPMDEHQTALVAMRLGANGMN